MAWNPSKAKVRRLIERDGRCCNYCGIELIHKVTGHEYNTSISNWACVDHVVPQSAGGSNQDENLVLCCRSCNTKKGSKTLEEFRHYVLMETLEDQILHQHSVLKKRYHGDTLACALFDLVEFYARRLGKEVN